ncbi:MAG TPA: alkaline phosphatase family protein [Patescibacteria group bacterium]|nr:alkaline phosphatase family protein [Patescibacteria group bacterium]
MSQFRSIRTLGILALSAASALAVFAHSGAPASINVGPSRIRHVFVIALENHNWTQPATVPGWFQAIYKNQHAPFINSLVNGTARAFIDGRVVDISKQVAYATAYHNVLATPSGSNPHIHPSEPNYLWAEAGTNFGVRNDDDPYKDHPPNVQNTTQHLTGLLQKARLTWRSYQEDIDLIRNANGKLINVPLPEKDWTVPLKSISGLFASGEYLNAYNDSGQYAYAPKHNPPVFFTDTNGGGNPTTANPMAKHYAPLQQLAFDLASGRVADYNWITPDLYNEMHSWLHAGFAGLTGDAARIRAADNTLSRLVPLIMSSKAYQDGGAIILWWDETEPDGRPGDNPDDFKHTLPEIIISPLAHPNVNGRPYASAIDYTHSSDLRTMQEIFHVEVTGGSSPYLGDAANAHDLSALFRPGVIPKQP